MFYGAPEPTYFVNAEPYGFQGRPHVVPVSDYRSRDDSPTRYRTRALVAPSSMKTHVVPSTKSVNNVRTHPKVCPHLPSPVIVFGTNCDYGFKSCTHDLFICCIVLSLYLFMWMFFSPFLQGLVLQVPMCCDKCVEKVGKALEDLEGVSDVVCDQYQQKVVISGDVDPEKVLHRVRRVKKKSKFWRMATQPIQYSGNPAFGQVHTKPQVNLYRAPGYHTSAYRAPTSAYTRYLSPTRYTSSYLRHYSSPYIDSEYRSGYMEPRYGSVYDRLAFDDLEYHSRLDRGTPYFQMNDV